jgi:protein-disulfide isomerase
MKNILLIVLCLLLLINICIQGTDLYKRYAQRQPTVMSVKAGTTLDLSGRPVQGKVTASKIIVEFGDYECPACLRYAKETLPILRQKLVDRGIIRYAYMNCPLPIHKNARLLATAALCADKQNQYWAMHDLLVDKRPTAQSDVLKIAETLGLDRRAYERCLISTASETEINKDFQQAKDLGLRATPSFAAGVIRPDGQILVQKIIAGAQPLSVYERVIGEIQ